MRLSGATALWRPEYCRRNSCPFRSAIAADSEPFSQYLAAEGVGAESRAALLSDLERLACSYARLALDRLGWVRTAGETVDPDELRQRLGVAPEHGRLFRRMLVMMARAGVLDETGDGFTVVVGTEDPLPEVLSKDPPGLAGEMKDQYPHGTTEIGLFRRSAGALPDVLVGDADPLTLLFSSGEPSAADLYLKAPVAQAANRMLGDAVAALLAELPVGRRLRVLGSGGRHRFGHCLGAARAAPRALRLHVYRHLRWLLLRSGGPVWRRRGIDRLSGFGHRG